MQFYSFSPSDIVEELSAHDDEEYDNLDDGWKCTGCNWTCTTVYVLSVEDDVELAKKLIADKLAGMCGECFSAFLAEDVVSCGSTG
jgi:hypothetical protein